jgi:hypothetical protein
MLIVLKGSGVCRDMFNDGLFEPFFAILERHGLVDVQFVPSSLWVVMKHDEVLCKGE